MYVLSGGMALGAILLALFISSVVIPIPKILHIISNHMFGWGWLEYVPRNIEMIIWEIRFPRVLLAFLVGAALALSGAAFQGLLRNPLADPYTIGVSSGAALGAVSVIFFQIAIFGMFTLPIFGIVGGFIALIIVFSITRMSGKGFAIETIILAGIIVGSFIGSFISLIMALSGEDLGQIMYWLWGSVGMRGWSHVHLLVPFFIVGSLLLLVHHRELNALAFGEESAQHLGVNVNKRKIYIIVGASLLTGSAVAVSGMIGFVGLVMPHLVRLLVGPDHRHLLPLAMLLGGTFLVSADLVSRMVIAPKQLPIGVITALIGAPVFAVILMRGRARKGGH